MSLPTLYAPRIGLGRPGDEVELPESERSHLRALRLSPGDRVELTDGRGLRWTAEYRGDDDSRGRCSLIEPATAAADLPAVLAFGVANKDRTLWLVEKAVELGVRGLQPLELTRSRSVADASRSTGFWAKAERRALAALKQCGGGRLPAIAPVLPLEEWLADGAPTALGDAETSDKEEGAPLGARGPIRLLASADAERTLLDRAGSWRPGRGAVLLVGPEGGLTGQESRAAREAGFEPVGLGPRTLRFETAAIAGLSVLSQLRDTRRGPPGI